MTAEQVAEILGLEPHPEGGYFKETFRSSEEISSGALPDRYNKARSIYTSIYFLITEESFSAMHRLKSDEIFHFYMGDPALIFMIHPDGRDEEKILGNDLLNGARLQILIPRHVWFGIKVIKPGKYTLTGTTMAPGFDFNDFEMADSDNLCSQYPQHTEKIQLFTRV